ncbi:MAG: hypothetical protein HQL98_03025 [Magnetococcales bacterium]|nr:hypothetical protein [Magnetococcales bacterium]
MTLHDRHQASGLDLVSRDPKGLNRPVSALSALSASRAAFEESVCPLRLDRLDWARIPECVLVGRSTRRDVWC